jgi:hypothetical protein
MRCRPILLSLIGILFSIKSCVAQAVQTAPSAAPYTFHIPADEISLRFHASDGNGKPMTQLTVADLELTDNRKVQKHIVTLQSLGDLPIRAGFVFDISASVIKDMDFYQSVIQIYASRLLRRWSLRTGPVSIPPSLLEQPGLDHDPIAMHRSRPSLTRSTLPAATSGPRKRNRLATSSCSLLTAKTMRVMRTSVRP